MCRSCQTGSEPSTRGLVLAPKHTWYMAQHTLPEMKESEKLPLKQSRVRIFSYSLLSPSYTIVKPGSNLRSTDFYATSNTTNRVLKTYLSMTGNFFTTIFTDF